MPVSVDERCLRLTDDDGRSGVLLGMRCSECGVSVFGPATFCQACTSPQAGGYRAGRRRCAVQLHHCASAASGLARPVPYVLGEVELPEGPHVLAEVIRCDHDALTVGMLVTLALETVSMGGVEESERVVYKWRPR